MDIAKSFDYSSSFYSWSDAPEKRTSAERPWRIKIVICNAAKPTELLDQRSHVTAPKIGFTFSAMTHSGSAAARLAGRTTIRTKCSVTLKAGGPNIRELRPTESLLTACFAPEFLYQFAQKTKLRRLISGNCGT